MIEIRPTRPGDLPGLDRLFSTAFGHGLEAADWEWKYRRLPEEGRSLVALDDAGAVLAHAGALRLTARSRGREAGLWQLADFAGVASGSGLRPPLVAAGRRLLADLPGAGDLPWIFGFPSLRHFRLGQRAFGYRPLAEVQPLVGSLGGPLPERAAPDPARAAPADRLDPGSTLAERSWEGCAVDGVVRTTAFLNRRYHDRPGRYYRYYRLVAGDAEGLAVVAFVGREGWMAELWLPPGEGGSAGEHAGGWYDALSAVAADLRAAGLTAWRFWPPPRPDLGSTLARLGLGPAGEPHFIGCRGAPDMAGFYFAMGDYDAV